MINKKFDSNSFSRVYFSNISAALTWLNKCEVSTHTICAYGLFWNLSKLPESFQEFNEIKEFVKAGSTFGSTADHKTGKRVSKSGNNIHYTPRVHGRLKEINTEINTVLKEEYGEKFNNNKNKHTGTRRLLEEVGLLDESLKHQTLNDKKTIVNNKLSVGIEFARPDTDEEFGRIWSLQREKHNIVKYIEEFDRFPIMNIAEQIDSINPDTKYGKNLLEKQNLSTINFDIGVNE
jgi:hypothetical protein|tara:strand:- start:41 stop:742 length:702 start_codon:yes stop_codon:yes gene_type:complete